MHTRQLDMIMSNVNAINQYADKMLREISSFVHVPKLDSDSTSIDAQEAK